MFVGLMHIHSVQVDLYNSTEESRCAISGIFIKNVIQESPAGKSGELKVLFYWKYEIIFAGWVCWQIKNISLLPFV